METTMNPLITKAVEAKGAKLQRTAENIAIARATGRISEHDVDERIARLGQ
jgi:hypothetical protein